MNGQLISNSTEKDFFATNFYIFLNMKHCIGIELLRKLITERNEMLATRPKFYQEEGNLKFKK